MLRQGWYTTADFADRVWTVHHQPADHWRALQLHVVQQELSHTSELVTCQACIEHEFNPPQCSQPTGRKCVALLAGHKGSILPFLRHVFSISRDHSAPCSDYMATQI